MGGWTCVFAVRTIIAVESISFPVRWNVELIKDGVGWRCTLSGMRERLRRTFESTASPYGEAATTFGDLPSVRIDDPVHSEVEDRFVIVGASVRQRLLVTAFTERDDRIRIISSRRATSNERAQYEQRLKEDE